MGKIVEVSRADALLGVERSFRDRRWRARPVDERGVAVMARELGGVTGGDADALARVLSARGATPETAVEWLDPTLRRMMPDPSVVMDMEAAAHRLARAVVDGERIAIFGDYDVDGATSSALMTRWLRALGREAMIYVPDRLTEGYGPNGPAMRALAKAGARVVVTVDCGTAAAAALSEARDAGLDVIVCDHHLGTETPPPAVAVVNPNRPDDTSGLTQLAAVGVAFLLAIATNRVLRAAGRFPDRAAEPDMMALLDLVALGTVADVAPITGLNRAFVAQGLKVMARNGNAGVTALMQAAAMKRAVTARDLGFLLGPRVNAGGRVGRSDLGARLLSTDDPGEAAEIAEELEALNRERRAIEAQVTDAALTCAAEVAETASVTVVAGEGWHPGVIGIVASRLKERFGKPAVVIGLDGETGKGSGRSIRGVNLGAAICAARDAGVLINGGGHAMAGGLTIAAASIDAFTTDLDARLAAEVTLARADRALEIDVALDVRAADAALVDAMERAGPFGVGNPAPRVALSEVRVAFSKPVGDGHLSVRLQGRDGTAIRAIAFRLPDGPLRDALTDRAGLTLHVAGALRRDDWAGGDAVQLEIEDAARAT